MNFQLTPHERMDPLWTKLAAHLRDHLATLRAQNDGQQPEADTQLLRGRINEVKRLLALGDEPPAITD